MTSEAAPKPLPLLGNVVFNVGARGALILLTIVSTPVVLHRLGTAAFGVYVLAITIGGLLALLDFGLTPALITLLSRAWHLQHREESERLVGTALSLYLLIGAIGAAVFALLVPWAVSDLLHVPGGLQHSARAALWISTAGFALNMWLAVFNAVPYALQRYDIVAARVVGLSLLTTIGLIVYALVGGVLEGFVLINLGGTVAGLLIFYLVSRALMPGIRFIPRADRESFRRLLRFSVFKFAGTVGGIFTFRFDQFAVGAILGVSAAGLYSIPANATQKLLALLLELASPVFPRASTMRGDEIRLRRLFFAGSRLVALAAMPALALLFALAWPTLRYWIGGAQGVDVANSSTGAFRWLLAALLFQTVAIMPSTFCEAMNRPEINNSFAVASALINVPLVLLLTPRLGITGAGLALFLNSSTQTLAFIIYASRRLFALDLVQLLRATVIRPLIAALITATAAAVLAAPLIHNRLTLVLALGISMLVYLLLALALSAITRDDLAYGVPVVERLPVWLPGRGLLLDLGRRATAQV